MDDSVTSNITTEVPTGGTFLSTEGRLKMINLTYPVEVDGTVYRRVVLKRLSAKEVADWQRQIEQKAKSDPDATVFLPIVHDEHGNPISQQALSSLDDDDMFEIEKAMTDFLPQRFREAFAFIPDNGEASAS